MKKYLEKERRMKKILFVSGPYVEQKSPNGICLKNIIEDMKYLVHCDVMSMEEKNVDSLFKDVYPLKIERNNFISSIMNYPVRNRKGAEYFYNKLRKRHEREKYDIIIAVTNPTETVYVVSKLKKELNNFIFFIYEIDSASNRYKLPKKFLEKYLMYRAMNWECNMYTVADKIIHMKTHKEHYMKKTFEEFCYKEEYLDIPSLIINSLERTFQEKRGHKFLYAGQFYPILRNPEYMLRCMCEYFKKNSFQQEMTIYSSTMKEKVKKIIFNCESIVYKESISQEKLNIEMEKYDVLISIGNFNSDFLPSKIFSYIATNKKIIHFYSDNSDVAISYLLKYENCLLIKENDDIKNVVIKIENFLNKESIFYSKEKLKKLYIENTPEYTSKKILEWIDTK